MEKTREIKRRPPWLKVPAFGGQQYHQLRKQLRGLTLHTVCEEANCPNRGECFNSGTATFLLMGPVCSRHCQFCNIASGWPEKVDPEEPQKIAQLAKGLNLSHVVLTSVTRDDLPDEGAGQFHNTIQEIRKLLPRATTEVLTPDFNGRKELIDLVMKAQPTVFNHNVETVNRLYKFVRAQSDYRRSLDVLKYVAGRYPAAHVKSGVMVGLGETMEEMVEVFRDLAEADIEILTIGQYLRPSKKHYSVAKYYSPDEFIELKALAERLGIVKVISGPLVRSSYKAGDVLN